MTQDILEPLINFERFSKWNRLLRCVAYVIRYCGNLRAKVGKVNLPVSSGYLKSEELLKAEKLIFKIIQVSCYSSEIKCLQQNEGQ